MAGSGLRGSGGSRNHRVRSAGLAALAALFALPLSAGPAAAAANPLADLDQCENGGVGDPVKVCTGANWVNGNLNEQKAHYAEGDFVPYRVLFENLSIGTHTVEIEWGTTKNGKHAIDYIGSYNATETNADPCSSNTLCTAAASTTFPIPADLNVPAGIQKPGVLTMWGATMTGTGGYVLNGPYTGDSKTKLIVTFTASTAAPVLAWAGHIATRLDWGAANSAVTIPGSPYHSRIASLDGGGGGQDKSLSASAVIFPGSITITKQATPEGARQFSFSASDGLGTFTLVDDGAGAGLGSQTFSGLKDFVGTYDFTETVPAGWTLSSIGCSPSTGTTTDVGTATASVKLTEGATVECTFTNADVVPTIRVTKTPTPATVNEPGGNVAFGVVVTNNSSAESVTLTSLSDAPYGNVALAAPANPNVVSTTCSVPQTLAASGSYSCSFTARVSGNAGSSHTDTITASASDADGNPITGSASATVTVTNVNPSVSITKTPTPAAVPEPGGQVSFGLSITNTSPESVTLYEVSDAPYGNKDAACGVPRTLTAGQTVTCSFNGQVTGNVGSSHTDTATAKVRDDEGNTASNAAGATVNVTNVNPSVTITKIPNPTTVAEPGGAVAFGLSVTNTSVEPVTLGSLVDTPYGNVAQSAPTNPNVASTTCSAPRVMAINETYTCSFTARVTGNAGSSHTDTATASVTDDEGNTASSSADATVTVTNVNPSVTVTKTATPTSVPEPGGQVTFDLSITSTSVEDVTLYEVSDAPYGNKDAACGVPRTMTPGQTVTCSFTGQVTGNAGSTHTDTVTAKVRDDESNTASASANATVTVTDVLPSVAITKTATPSSVPEPSGRVSFVLVVDNGSVEPVMLFELHDSIYGDLASAANPTLLASTCAVPAVIAVGDDYTCSFTAEVKGNAGHSETDTVTAKARDDEGNVAQAAANATVTVTDAKTALVVDKTASKSVVRTGEAVTYTYAVSTPGAESLLDVKVVDDKCSPVTFVRGDTDGDDELDPGESWAFTCSMALTGNTTNTAVATAEDDEGNVATATDTATVEVVDPRIAIDKEANPKSASPGDRVVYTYLVTNPGDAALTTVVVSDDKCSPVAFAGGDTDGDAALDPGETWRYTCEVTVGSDVSSLTNIGTVTAKDPTGATVSADDTETIAIVLGVVIERPRATVLGVTLPRTGGELLPWASAGGVLVGLGAVLLVWGRRRRTA